MAYDKVIDSAALNANLTTVADAIRAKGGTSGVLSFPTGFADAIAALEAGGGAGGGGGGATISGTDVVFYDYDGTVVAGYSASDALALTELPPGPTHDGLTFQGWNWSLSNMQSYVTKSGKCYIGAMYITDDGKTRIYIHLEEGRTSPMLGVCPNGTVTVDWGDGTTPNTLTGTNISTVKWTPKHNYAEAGDYVITLTVNGTMGFYGTNSNNQHSGILRHSSSADARNYVYPNAVQRIEVGDGVTSIGNYAFYYCYSLASITIPNSLTSIGNYAFFDCTSLASITIPNSVTSIGSSAIRNCTSLARVAIPDSVTSTVRFVFYNCYSLASVTIPDGVTSIDDSAFYNCYSLANVTIPDSVTSIGSGAFYKCYGVAFYDFTALTAVPTLANTNAFTNIAADCQIRVPASLYDEWIAATNWSTYASYIVAV